MPSSPLSLPSPVEPCGSTRPTARAAVFLLTLAALILAPWALQARDLSITGTLLDEEGQPLEGTEVTLHRALAGAEKEALLARGAAYPKPAGQAVTDREGHFRLTAPDPDFWTVVARAEGRYPMEYPLWPLVQAKELEAMKLPSAETLRVLVTDAAGREVPGAVISFSEPPPKGAHSEWPGAWRLAEDRVTTTDDRGRAELPRLADEEVGLWARARTSLGEAEAEAPSQGSPKPVEIVLRDAPSLRLQILTADGRPAPEASIWHDGPIPVGVTDEQGLVDVPLASEPPSGPVAVGVGPAEGLVTRAEVPWPPEGAGDEEPFTVRLDAPPVLSGRVIDAGSGDGVPEALVWLGKSLSVTTRTDRTGSFRIEVRWPRPTQPIQVAAPGFLAASSWIDEMQPGSTKELTFVLDPALSLRGRVVSRAGQPIAGAQVAALPDDPKVDIKLELVPGLANGTTDEDGSFQLDQVSAGGSTLLIVAKGYAPLYQPTLDLEAVDGIRDLGDVVLEPEALLTGQVVDDEGEPLPGVSLTAAQKLASAGPFSMFPPPTGVAETGPDGTFEIGGIGPGRPTTVVARKEGYASATAKTARTPNDEPVVIILRPSGAVVGTVVDEQGRPVSNAVLRPSARSLFSGGRLFRPTKTDDRGAFELAGLDSGKIYVMAEAPGYRASVPLTLEISPGERHEEVKIVLKKGIEVTGRVVDPEGHPVAGASVSSSQESGERAFLPSPSAESRDDGSFTLEGLAPGRAVLRATTEGYSPGVRTIEVGPGGAPVDLRLGRGTEIGGRVLLPDGSPAVGKGVYLMSEAGGPDDVRRTTTKEDGSFAFQGVPDGNSILRVHEHRTARPYFELVSVEDGTPVLDLEILLPGPVTLTGRLLGVEPADLAGLEVSAWQQGMKLLGSRPGEVHADGTYVVSDLTPGSWTVTATSSTEGPQGRSKIEIEEGDTAVTLDLDLAVGFTVTGTVTSGGEPVPGARVRGGATSSATTTDLEGRFRLEGVPEGSAGILVMDPRSGSPLFYRLEVDGDEEIEIEIEEGAKVRGVVLSADGSGPVAGAPVTLRCEPDRSKPSFSFSPRAVTGADGTFLLTGAHPGPCRLLVEAEGYAPYDTGLEVVGSEVEAAPIFLDPAGNGPER